MRKVLDILGRLPPRIRSDIQRGTQQEYYEASNHPEIDRAGICVNGHVVTSVLERDGRVSPYCSQCGAAVITECQQCRSAIPGSDMSGAAFAIFPPYVRPQFCQECGQAFPWTALAIEAAKELAEDFDRLDVGERAELAATIPDLTSNGPRTTLAVTRARRLLAKAGTVAAESMRTILVDAISKAVEKALFGP